MKLDKIVQNFRDERSQEMYGKNEYELTIAERMKLDEYIKDWTDPTWKRMIFRGKERDYFINNLGEIQTFTAYVKKPYIDQYGYAKTVVSCVDNNKHIMCTASIHRLVAETFIPNPENKPEVNHIIPRPSFNWVGNLEWVTHKENIHWAIHLGNNIVGVDHKNSKCTEEQIHEVCKLLEKMELNLQEISKKTGVPIRTIQHIRFDGGWPHISKQYNISKIVKTSGPQYSPLSLKLIDLINEGKSNSEIYEIIHSDDILMNSPELSKCKNKNKSIRDRMYHIKKMMKNGTLNDYRT